MTSSDTVTGTSVLVIGDDVTSNHDTHNSIEPTAAQRAVARTLWELYVALVQVGFNDAQALHIVTATVTQAVADTTELSE